MNADGSGKRRLTRDVAYDMYPSWSPDGTKIAFGSDRAVPSPPGEFIQEDVYLMNADGANVRNLTRTRAVAEGFPAWRADGTLSYVRGNDRAHPPTFWISAASARFSRSLGFGGQFPAWERPTALGCDARPLPPRLAFARTGRDDRFDIYVAEADGTGTVDITNSSEDERYPRWSPDGSRLLFIRGGGRTSGALVIADGAGSVQEELALPSLGGIRSATWSPDGRRVAFSVWGAGGAIFLAQTDGSQLRRLGSTVASDTPSWSPDGRFLAYRQEYASNDEIVRVRIADGRVKRLTQTRRGRDDLTPAWSPDGTKVVYASGSFPDQQIWIMRSDGTFAHRLTGGSADEGFPAWTDDGGRVVYERHGSLWTVRADGTGQRPLLPDAHFPSWKPCDPTRAGASLSFRARLEGRRRLLLTGRLTTRGAPIGNALIQLSSALNAAGSVSLERVRTGGDGRFEARVPARIQGARSNSRATAFFAGDSATMAAVSFAYRTS